MGCSVSVAGLSVDGSIMNQSETSVSSQIRSWASRQLADYDARQPGSIFAEGVVLSVPQGYQLQSAVADLRCRRGERMIGYKIGCTSPKIRAQLGIDHCVTGRLYESEQHPSGAVLSRNRFASLAIEGELAVRLSRAPTEHDFVKVGIPSCVAEVFPVIELHHHVLRGGRPSAGEIIANNAIHAGFVAGPGVSPEQSLGTPTLQVFADDQLLDQCAGFVLTETIHSSLKWLMKTVSDRGDQLAAGQIILTGSIPSLIPIGKDCRVRVDAQPFGSVEMTLMDSEF
jgi:2-keto-4-pentenoate hydratase